MPLVETLPPNGTYTLIIFLSKELRSSVGKLGVHKFPMGYYTYTGSAMGRSGLSLKYRVSRHLRKEKRKLWHIDFLLANEDASIIGVVAALTHKKLECSINRYIKTKGKAKIPVAGFGATDCKDNCGSHLLHFGEENISKHIGMFYNKHLGSEFVSIDFDKCL
jgi:Uri superfamily endonuclease